MTEAGRRLHDRAVDLVEAQQTLIDAAQDVNNDVAGLVRVGANRLLAIAIVTPVIFEYQRLHPGLLSQIREGPSKELEEHVARGQLDFAVMTTPPYDAPGGVARDPVADFSVAAYVPVGHKLHDRDGVSWTELAGIPLVTMRKGTTLGDRVFAQLREPRIVAEVASLHHVPYMVDNGMGVGIGSPLIAPFSVAQGRWVPIDGERMYVHILRAVGVPTPKFARVVRAAVRRRLLREAQELR